MSVGNAHTFTQFLQEWQYVCAQFTTAQWDIVLWLHNRDYSVPADRILPIVHPLAMHVKHYDMLTGYYMLLS